ncbi:MAG: phosphosulfolactate synthase [Bacillota bacterium]
MKERAFSSIGITQRSDKPRINGITMVFDYGMGLLRQEDLLQAAGEYIDLAKIRVGSAALYSEAYLKRKIELYKKYNVGVFPGGMFLEYAISRGKTDEYFSEVTNYGFEFIEISDNVLEISYKEKVALISNAVNNYKLKVIAEVGSKVNFTSLEEIVKDIKFCQDAGAWKIILEAKEFYENGKFRTDMLNQICERIDPEILIFEVPTLKVSGTSHRERYLMQTWLVGNLGNDVNVGNIEPDEILVLEATRRNLEAENMKL